MGGLAIYKAEKQEDGGLVADRKLYLTRESAAGQRVVEFGDADAGYLFATPGTVIPIDQVKAHNLEIKDGRIQQAKKADGSVAVALPSYDQETGPALKKAADEKRKVDLGKTQTSVAVMEPPPGHEEGVARRDAVVAAAAEEKPAPEVPARPVRVVKVASAKKKPGK